MPVELDRQSCYRKPANLQPEHIAGTFLTVSMLFRLLPMSHGSMDVIELNKHNLGPRKKDIREKDSTGSLMHP